MNGSRPGSRPAGRRRPGYDGYCRDRDVAESTAHAVRFRVPHDGGATSWDDLIRGPISFEHANLEDFVLRRTDGTPVFIVANAVDDADMGITHVIRGEDLINVTPKVLLVRAALGVEGRPEFAHMPLIVNEARKKLSKRRDDVSVGDYRDRGVLPEAMTNYLALLGWGPPDGVEVRPIGEIIALFDVADINTSPAMFDVKKLESINGDYIRALPVEDFIARCRPYLDAEPWADAFDDSVFASIAAEIQTAGQGSVGGAGARRLLLPRRTRHRTGRVGQGGRVQRATPVNSSTARSRRTRPRPWDAESLHGVTMALAESFGLKLGKAQAPIRVAVTGRTVGPPLFESLAVLGTGANAGAPPFGAGPPRGRCLSGERSPVGYSAAGWSSSPPCSCTWWSPLSRCMRTPAPMTVSTPAPSWCWVPPSTTAGRRRCCRIGSITRSSCIATALHRSSS